MAVKYRLSFSNINLEQVVVEISHPDYVGDAIPVIGVGGESYSLSRAAIETPHDSHVIPTTANISLYTDLIDVDELQQANDKSWRVFVTVDGVTDFSGYIIPDGIQKTLKGAGNIVRINATCGLSMMKGIVFEWLGANWGSVTVNGVQSAIACPMNFIRMILEGSRYVNQSLPIQWSTSIKYDVSNDFLAGTMPFSSTGSLASLIEKEIDTFWILENIVKSAKCVIVQDKGKWSIINYEDLIRLNGVIDVLEIPAQQSSVTASSSTVDFNIDLNGKQIFDDAYITIKKSVGSLDITYDSVYSKNIVPNGDFSDVYMGSFLDWDWSINPSDRATASVYEVGGLTENGGNSADLVFPAIQGNPLDEYAVFSMYKKVSIGAKTLFRDFSMGFVFLPLNGFTYNNDTKLIDWTKGDLQVKVQFFSQTGITWYLNEYGFWQKLPPIGFLDYTQQNLSSKKWRYIFSGSPMKGNLFKVRYKYENLGVTTYHTAEYVVTEGDELLGISVMVNNMKTAFQSQLKPSANWIITNDSTSITIENTFAGTISNEGTMINSQSGGITEDGYIPLLLGESKIADIVSVDFRGLGSRGSDILMPKEVGELQIHFKVKEGQRYVIDNVYININDNKDVYRLDLNTNSNEKYELGISTSVNGFFDSNYRSSTELSGQYNEMTDYSGSNKSLTELYGRGVLNWRNKARKIYNGTFKSDIPYISLVDIGGVKYVPTGMDSNKTNGQMTLQGFQAVLDVVSPKVTHKGSNINK